MVTPAWGTKTALSDLELDMITVRGTSTVGGIGAAGVGRAGGSSGVLGATSTPDFDPYIIVVRWPLDGDSSALTGIVTGAFSIVVLPVYDFDEGMIIVRETCVGGCVDAGRGTGVTVPAPSAACSSQGNLPVAR